MLAARSPLWGTGEPERSSRGGAGHSARGPPAGVPLNSLRTGWGTSRDTVELSGEPAGVGWTGSYCQNLLRVRASGGPIPQLSTTGARTQGCSMNEEKAPSSLLWCPSSDKARWLKRTAYRVQLLDHKQGNKEWI